MKRFNLERAQAGDRVITRDGITYVFGAINAKAQPSNIMAGWIDGNVVPHFIDGAFRSAKDSNEYDLFMAPKKVTYWYAVARFDFGPLARQRHMTPLFVSREELVNSYTPEKLISEPMSIELEDD